MNALSKIKWMKPVIRVCGKVVKYGKQNSNWILAIMAWLGLAGTTVLAVDATVKAVKLCESKEVHGRKEIIRTTWRLFIPAIGTFIVTTMTIVGNAHLNGKVRKSLATMTGLYAMSQADLRALKEKATEVMGPRKEQNMQDEIDKKRLEKIINDNSSPIIETGHGNKLFVEWLTGQRIRTSPEWVAMNSEKMDHQFTKEPDGVVEVGYYLDLFNIPTDCWVASAYWDMAEMVRYGQTKFEIDCREIQWMEINGQQEMVGIIKPPAPTGV